MRVVVCNNGYYSKPGTSSICLASSSWSQVECRGNFGASFYVFLIVGLLQHTSDSSSLGLPGLIDGIR